MRAPSPLCCRPAGDRAAYADPSTLKVRLKRVFADKAGGGGSTPRASFASVAMPSPTLSYVSDASSAAPPRAFTPLGGRSGRGSSAAVADRPSSGQSTGPGVRPTFAASDALPSSSSSSSASAARSPLRQERRREKADVVSLSPALGPSALPPLHARGASSRADSTVSFASPPLSQVGSRGVDSGGGARGGRPPATDWPSGGSDVSNLTTSHRDSILSANTAFSAAAAASAAARPSPYQAGGDPSASGPRWGNLPHPWASRRGVVIRHFPAQADGAVRLALVLERRPAELPLLKELNKWQHRQCAECGAMQTTGLGLLNTGLPAHFCNYTELLFCERCMAPEPRPIPWRIVHELDDEPRPVSRNAAEYVDRILGAPIVALSALAPRTLARSEPLQQVMQLRARIADLLEAIAVGAAELERNGGEVRPSAVSAVSGDDESGMPGGGSAALVPSEQLSPLKHSVQTSRAAAAAFRDCSRLFRKSVGDRFAFMVESVELLPLSLIARIDGDGQDRIVPRLAAAARALEQYAVSRGFLAPAGRRSGS